MKKLVSLKLSKQNVPAKIENARHYVPIPEQFEQTTMESDDGKKVSVVKVLFSMNQPVEDSIYNFLID